MNSEKKVMSKPKRAANKKYYNDLSIYRKSSYFLTRAKAMAYAEKYYINKLLRKQNEKKVQNETTKNHK